MEEIEQKTSQIILGPLNLSNTNDVILKSTFVEIFCLFDDCKEVYKFPDRKDDYLAHLYIKHRLVISDVGDIASMEDYLVFWKKEFCGHTIEEFCTPMIMHQLPDGTPSKNEMYFLLSEVLPKDYEIRQSLHAKRLESVLVQHQFERTDQTYEKGCLYCRDVVRPSRSDFLEHLYKKHFLLLGKPDNLVFIDELIEVVQEKMDKLICLFCEKIFKDRTTLKEHMRKKGHKRINPENKIYDKYFLINYKNNKSVAKAGQQNRRIRTRSITGTNKPESRVFNTDDSDSDWSDWEGEKQNLTCLFCPIIDTDFISLKKHMTAEHGIDFEETVKELNFYQKIKIVNYIRRQMHILRCVTCNDSFETTEDLQKHLKDAKHYGIGEKTSWDQPEFFFSTYEDDNFLCYLEDNQHDNSSEDSATVFSEDCQVNVNTDAENLLKEKFNL